jgi:enoyl-CoA hydratase/carnithine racemase
MMSSIVDRSTKSQVKLVDCKDRVAHVTIDCPPLNLINTALLGSLAEMLSELAADPQVRAIVLDTANGVPPFAADAGELTALTTWQQTFEMLKRGQEALTTIEFLPRPVIMAIYDGMCIGGGLELALSCHLRVAGSQTRFAVPEAPAGSHPGWGNTQRLARLFGRSKSLELILTGNEISAREAYALGVINHVVPGDQVLATATELAHAIARVRTKSVVSVMSIMNVPYALGLAEGKAKELEQFMRIYDPDTLREV